MQTYKKMLQEEVQRVQNSYTKVQGKNTLALTELPSDRGKGCFQSQRSNTKLQCQQKRQWRAVYILLKWMVISFCVLILLQNRILFFTPKRFYQRESRNSVRLLV